MNNEKLTSPPRERVSVGITGIDRSTPDDMVEDGKCETLHNMRYEAGAWRPVHPYTLSKTIPNLPATMNVVYKHPAAPENIYIVEDFANNLYHYYAYDITKIHFEAGALTILIKDSTERLKVSHFGNILIFTLHSSVVYFILKSGEYKKINFPPYARLSIHELAASNPEPTLFWTESYDENGSPIIKKYTYSLEKEMETIRNGEETITYETNIYDTVSQTDLLPAPPGSMWRGELLLFSTWMLDDGTHLCPSPLLLVHSSFGVGLRDGQTFYISINNEDKILKAVHNKAKSSQFSYNTRILSSILPTIKASIQKDWDYSFVRKLVIWSTRNHPTFVNSKPYDPVEAEDTISCFADNDLANQPFYKLCELDVSDFTDDEEAPKDPNVPEDPEHPGDDGYPDDDGYPEYDDPWDPGEGRDDYYDIDVYSAFPSTESTSPTHLKFEFQITRDLLDSIITNEVYMPNNNTHITIPLNSLDYNNSFHIYNFRQFLAAGYHVSDSNPNVWGETPKRYAEWVEMTINDRNIDIVSSSVKQGLTLLDGTPMCRIISYPDARARKFSVEEHFRVPLKAALNNNFAWYRQPSTKYEKFPPVALDTRVLTGDELPKDGSIVSSPNKIQVSSVNNLFALPLDSAYYIGSNQNTILALQSAAIEMSDAKFGEMPLYAFTTEGIYALQVGAETLYSNIIPINYDRIINPNTLAVNGAIAYITEKGVHLLTNQGSQVISTPINDKSNRPPLDFLRKCKMIYPKEHNEIILLDEDNIEGIAYVYNLDARYWSTRDLKGKKLNTDELYSINILYDLANEDESKTLPAEIKTRPIKLGNVEFKRLETIIPRMSTHNHPALFTAEVTGSVDGFNYMPLRSTDGTIPEARVNPLVLRRTPFSAKYFKFGFTFNPSEDKPLDLSISHVDIEWYRKLQHRMR